MDIDKFDPSDVVFDERVFKIYPKQTLINMLNFLVDKLDELDQDGFCGTEGWKHYFGLND